MYHVLRAIWTWSIAGTLLATFQLLQPPSACAAGCADFDRAVREAESAADAVKAAALFGEAEAARACSGEELRHIGRSAALAFYRKAYMGSPAAAEQEGLLRQGLTLGRPWQLVASVGDLEQAAGKFEDAAKLYQEALDDVRDEVANPKPPPAETIAAIVKKAEEARLLSPVYVKRVDRDGAPSGLACPVFRGFEAKKTALPIEFAYRETSLTPKGQEAANDMFDYLSRQGAPDVHLIGHTDPRGSDEFNQDLSERRAEAVAGFLKSKGYKGKIATSGRGRKERFQADDPGRYSEEQLYQLDRRVELDRKTVGTGCAASAP
jgi:outer membrane protein OmpA-like peptidoglycan-associated protein